MRLAAVAAAVSVLAGCSSTSDPEPGPSSSGAAARALPEPAQGRLVRILGDGSSRDALGTGVSPALTSPVLQPSGLAVAGDALVGSQRNALSLFTLREDGTVRTAPPDQEGVQDLGDVIGYDASPLVAEVEGSRYVGVFGDGSLEVAGRADAQVVGRAEVPGGPTATAGSLVATGSGQRLVYGGRWFAVRGTGTGDPALRPVEAPVPGAVVAAGADGGGLTVLTKARVVALDGTGRVVSSKPWELPQRQQGESVTAAIGDGSGGLLVTVTRPTNQTSQSIGGAVLRIGRDGSVGVLAQGRPPASSSSGCDDADRPALDAHLAQPVSLVRWGERLVVADAGCGSVLQMPFPASADAARSAS